MKDVWVTLVSVVSLLATAASLFHHYVARVNKARAWLSRGAILVDVDSAEVFARVHARGAINIPAEELPRRADEVGPKDQSVVVFALRWARGAQAVHSLRRSGFVNVLNVAGLHTLEKLRV